MATLVHTYQPRATRITIAHKLERGIEKRLPHPRPCMVRSVSLILVGLSIPILMAVGLLPLSLTLFFVAFVLAAVGSVSALILCGEI